MVTYELKVPMGQDSDTWFMFIQKELVALRTIYNIDVLIVNFQGVKFLETDDFVVLACLIESFFIKGCKVEFIGGTDNFNHHLHNIKFKKYWEPGFDRENFTISLNRSTLCLWKINKERIYPYSQFAKEYFNNNFAENKDLLPFATNLDEVFNNIFDHSQAEVAYIITQYFPKIDKLSFSVCDFGLGIPATVNRYRVKKGQSTIEDWRAILLSTELGFSVESTPNNRGYGLNNLLDMVDGFKGTLSIISDNGFLIKSKGSGIRVTDTGYNFKGTLIKVEVDIDTFQTMDTTDETWGF